MYVSIIVWVKNWQNKIEITYCCHPMYKSVANILLQRTVIAIYRIICEQEDANTDRLIHVDVYIYIWTKVIRNGIGHIYILKKSFLHMAAHQYQNSNVLVVFCLQKSTKKITLSFGNKIIIICYSRLCSSNGEYL